MITNDFQVSGFVDDKYSVWCVSWWCVSGGCSGGPLRAFFPERPYRHVETYGKSSVSERKGGPVIPRAPQFSTVKNIMISVPVERSARFSHGGLLVFVVRRLGASAGRGSATLPLVILSYLSSSSFYSRIYRVYFSTVVSCSSRSYRSYRGSHLSPFLL